MNILAIESSCDETAAAVVKDGRTVLSNAVYSQIKLHAKYGGVVPEISSRAHTEVISDIVKEALNEASVSLSDIDAVAVTVKPGLIGALLVGVSFAKGLSYSNGIALIPVNHIRGHIAANYLCHPELKPPFTAFVMSGGHTSIVDVKEYTDISLIAETRDDAIGEAFDKTARILGIEYPGGKLLSDLAFRGKASYALPLPIIKDHPLDFSFSGLKTAVINKVHTMNQRGEAVIAEDLAASFVSSVTAGIENRLVNLFKEKNIKTLALAGGVSANEHIREKISSVCNEYNVNLFLPPISLCGDNAAMIGAQAYYEFLAENTASLSLNAEARSEL